MNANNLVGPLLLSAAFLLLGSYWKRLSDAGAFHTRKDFLNDARSLVKEGLRKANLFRIISETGPKTILAVKYADEIRNHHALSPGAAVARDFHSHIQGFGPFEAGNSTDHILQDAIRTKLTSKLGYITKSLSNEASLLLRNEWTDNREWHELNPKPGLLRISTQLSSKVFLGDTISRDPEWIRITIDYTVDVFIAAQALRRWPEWMRPVVACFLPSCRKIQQELQDARTIITPVLEERRRVQKAAHLEGRAPKQYFDAMQWMEETAKGRPYDPVAAQIFLSVASIQSISELLSQIILDLCGKEDIVQELRQEAISTIREEGITKASLNKLKLMDSVLKESQRLKPVTIVTMVRVAVEDVELSDGTIIPKGTVLCVSNESMWDPNIYSNPESFDPYRFLKLRETPGHEISAQLVSPSPEHMGFGYGKHACPGRFFAVDEIKILLCHILLKYDFRSPEGYTPIPLKNGFFLSVDPLARIMIQRRSEEILL